LLLSCVTVCESTADILVVKFVSPAYTAEMAWLPSARALVLKLALPPLNATSPRVLAPSLNVTVPVGVPEPGAAALTVAVNVTVCPKTDGLAEETTVVLLPSLLTVWKRVADVLPAKFVSPLYTAVITCVVTLKPLVDRLALPPLRVDVPITVEPSLKLTVPVGVPAPGLVTLTVAVNVTAWPNTDGFTEETTLVLVPAWFTVCDKALEVLPVKLLSPP
jgi:hypothetical protein